MSDTLIKKSSGELVPFSTEKLERSLFRSGASPELIKKITSSVLELPTINLSTKEVYKHAFQLLRKSSFQLAARYKLQKAILELGPSGYPFEEYVSHLFAFQGLDTSVGITMNGKRVTHEVDVWAKNHEVQYIVECKHHSNQNYKSDIKVILYVHSRFNDVVSQLKRRQPAELNYRCWIVTNTKFTTDAVSYASGENIELMAWNYPSKGSLRERIDISGLYPITCLCSLTKSEKQHLLDQKIVLCKEIIDNPSLLKFIRSNKTRKVIEECKSLVQG
ncbi:restriction endonuclease [Roseivirga sp. E12]|uniref:restriction endonuclease n=1 Tax=Roseivirga sp. E12 TaxID=2819237 RepID=UPI001ABC96AB|nr:restriction endonuclease [Roseivirga sp. E12]MBO3697120.1 restriction endonuclease [Roseivirga sp. E12]